MKAIIILNTNSYILAEFINKQVSQLFDTELFFIDENLDKTVDEMIKYLNKLILQKNVSTCFFQGDYLSLINYDFINRTNFEKKYIFLTDDFDTHEVNSQTALACDGIMTACPISKLKYNEKNLDASFFMNESDCDLFKNLNLEKDIDILFFGAFKADRVKYLNKLEKENKKIKFIQAEDKYLPYDELVKFICRSKLVVNFSKTGPKKKFYSHKTYPFNYLQYKGRVHISGLCGTLCVSEYSPAQKIIFGDTAPTFKNADEMLTIIDMFLNDDDLLKEKTKLFVDKCLTYCDKVHFPKVISELSKSNNKQIVNKLPYWYLRSFIIKSLRLFANKKSLKVLYKQFYQNILSYTKYSGFTYPLILIEAFFHLIFLQMKTIKNKIVK
jgi:phenolic acid decarboxylase|tara:strand:- start:2139 stop:3290 length:1152 start_codon:yes stop_codon:yes gene_type:complete